MAKGHNAEDLEIEIQYRNGGVIELSGSRILGTQIMPKADNIIDDYIYGRNGLESIIARESRIIPEMPCILSKIRTSSVFRYSSQKRSMSARDTETADTT